LPGWTCPHNHSRPDLAEACAQRYARSPAYQAEQAARRRQAEQREAAHQARQAARRERAAAKGRAILAQCIATAAAEVMAAIPEHGGTLPAGDGPAALEDAVREIIQGEIMTTDLDAHGGLDGFAQATAGAAAGRIMAAIPEHGGTLPAGDGPGALEDAVREIIRHRIVTDFPPLGKAAAKVGRIPRPAMVVGAVLALGLIFATHGLILIPVILAGAVLAIRRGKISKIPGLAIAAVLIALTATMSAATWSSGSSSAQVASQAPAAQAPATHAPASHAPVTHAPTHAPVTHAPVTHAPVTHAPVTHAPAPATHVPAPATQAPAPVAPSPSPTITHSAAPPPAPATSASAPPPASCSPLTNGGKCYEPGEYCRNSDHGMYGVAGDGEKIACEDNNGWRWEPV
jgi:hypothetical protein